MKSTTHLLARAGLVTMLAATGCSDEAPATYVPPDGSAWELRPTRWTRPDAGAAGYAFVSNSLMNSVSVLDLGTRQVLATMPVGVVPLTENGPHHLWIDPRADAVYTPLSFPPPVLPAGPHAAHGSSRLPGVLIKRSLTDFRLLGRVDVDPNPGDLVLSRDGARAFVSHYDLTRALANPGNRAEQRSSLVVIDTRTMQVTQRIPVCVAAHGMALSPDGRTVYMACYGDDALGVVSFTGTQPDAPVAEVRVIPIRELPPNPTSPTYGPYAITPSPDGSTVWVGCSPPNTSGGSRGLFIAFDTATMSFDTTRATTTLVGTPFFGTYAPDGATLVLPLQGRDAIARIAVMGSSLRVVSQTPVNAEDCTLPHQAAVGPDGLYYLVCEGVHTSTRREHGTVLALRPDDLSVVHRYEVGVFPDAITFMGARP